jgi:cellulose synthase operon protein C
MHNNQLSEAETELRKAVELAPEDVRTWNGLFELEVRAGRLDEARATLLQLAQRAEMTDAQRSFVLAQGYEVLGDRDQAATEYEQAAKVSPRDSATLLQAARFYRGSDLDRAIELAQQAMQADPRSANARHTAASLLTDRGGEEDWESAQRLLSQESLEPDSSLQDNRFQAMLLARRGGESNLEKAVGILKALAAQGGDSEDSDRLMLASLYERQAQVALRSEDVKKHLESAEAIHISLCSRTDVQPQHLLSFAQFLMRQQRQEYVGPWLDKLDKLLSAAGKPAPGVMAEYVRLRLAEGKPELAERWLTRLEKQQPDAWATIALRARLLEAKGSAADAEIYIEQTANRLLAERTEPGAKLAVLEGIGALYVSMKRHDLAEPWYRQLYQANPAGFELLAGVLAEQGRMSEAVALCEEAMTRTRSSRPALVTITLLTIHRAEASAVQAAERLLADARQRHPKDAQLLTAIATLRIVRDDIPKAIELYREVIRLSPRDVVALNNLATLLSEQPEHRKEALELIERAIKIVGHEPGLLDTKGTILIFDGRPEDAVDFLKAATRDQDADPRYRFHLALAYRDLKEVDAAKGELEAALARDLEKQILTPTEQELLQNLRAELSL